jgi:hypothetical protein
MESPFEIGLAFILFFPAFCIIGVLYSMFPRQPRGIVRVLGDVLVLIVAAVLSVFATRWGFHAAAGVAGPMWKQIVATLLAYGVFIAVVCLALPIRAAWFRRIAIRKARQSPS